jgi:hypothetical protein
VVAGGELEVVVLVLTLVTNVVDDLVAEVTGATTVELEGTGAAVEAGAEPAPQVNGRGPGI